MGWKYVLADANGNEITTSDVYEEEVDRSTAEDSIIQHRFKSIQSIYVQADQKLTIAMWMDTSYCRYSESGDGYGDIQNDDMGMFEFEDSPLSTNSTKVSRGILPGVLYYF